MLKEHKIRGSSIQQARDCQSIGFTLNSVSGGERDRVEHAIVVENVHRTAARPFLCAAT